MSKNQPSLLPPSFLPEKLQILSGSALKLIAIIVMLIDHGAYILLSQHPSGFTPFFYIGGNAYTPYKTLPRYWKDRFSDFLFSSSGGLLSHS